MPTLSDIPYEVCEAILLLLSDIRDVLACKKTSRYFHRLFEESITLQYRNTLAFAGYESNGPIAAGSISERLDLFHKHQEAWRDLDWEESRLMIPLAPSHKLQDGILVYGDYEWLTCVELPSKGTSTELRSWKLEFTEFFVMDFAIDPSRDLLVILALLDESFEVRIRSLSPSDTPHPFAKRLQISDRLFILEDTSIELAGSRVGVIFPEDWTLVIWDIVTGNVSTIFEGRVLHKPIQSFCFLDENRVLVPSIFGKAFQRHGVLIPSLDVYDFSDGQCKLIASFQLPFPHPSTKLQVQVHSSPSSPSTANHDFSKISCASAASQAAPFRPNYQQCTVLITWVARRSACLRFLVPVYVFLRPESFLSADEKGGMADKDVEWERWGPRYSRIIDANDAGITLTGAIHGNRYVSKPMRDPNWPFDQPIGPLTVYDFGRRIPHKDGLTPNGTMIQDHISATDFHYPGQIMNPVMSSLPYRSSTRDGLRVARPEFGGSQFLCDEEHIVVLGEIPGSVGDDQEAFVYTIG